MRCAAPSARRRFGREQGRVESDGSREIVDGDMDVKSFHRGPPHAEIFLRGGVRGFANGGRGASRDISIITEIHFAGAPGWFRFWVQILALATCICES